MSWPLPLSERLTIVVGEPLRRTVADDSMIALRAKPVPVSVWQVVQ